MGSESGTTSVKGEKVGEKEKVSMLEGDAGGNTSVREFTKRSIRKSEGKRN